MRLHPRYKRQFTPLSAGINWNDVGEAMLDPKKGLYLPIKLPPLELGPQTRTTIVYAAGLLVLGAITTAALIKRKQ